MTLSARATRSLSGLVLSDSIPACSFGTMCHRHERLVRLEVEAWTSAQISSECYPLIGGPDRSRQRTNLKGLDKQSCIFSQGISAS